MTQLLLAGCILLNEQGDMLLLHRNTPKRVQWEIPGGKVEPGEHAATTAARELHEELNVIVEVGDELGSKTFTEDDRTMHYSWFLGRIVKGAPQIMEPQTHDTFAYMSMAALAQMSDDLSPNLANFVAEVAAGRIVLDNFAQTIQLPEAAAA